MVWTHPTKVVVTTTLAASAGALYGFASMSGLAGYDQIFLEATALTATVMTGAVAGIALEVHWMSKMQSGRLHSTIDGLLIGAIALVAWIYAMVQHVGVEEFGIYGVILKATTLVVLIVIGVMLGVKLGTRYGMISIGDAANASRDKHHTRRITDVELRKWLYGIANATLVGVVVVAIYAPAEPTYPVTPDGLLTASVTIMGFAAFGSALSTLGQSKDLIKGIAYTLIPVIVVQAAFMLSLLGHFGFPASWWIAITTFLLMLLVLVMFANRIKPAGVDSGTGHLRYF